jgi:biofilm PGA synthesis N-glycosyltransferase PgaC
MAVAIFIFFIVYFILVWLLQAGFVKAVQQEPGAIVGQKQFISVIIPFRNEEKHISFLLNDLLIQQYPTDQFEIILVNDHSQDQSLQRIETAIHTSSFSNITIVHPAASGKKAALSDGIKQAKGAIIATSDADCRMGERWLESIHRKFSNEFVKLVFGPVKIEPTNSLFSSIQSIEFSSLIGSGAATMAYGVPTMCNGANLAFRKDTFYEVDGYEGNTHIASGDDEFLMRKIAGRYPDGIQFNNTQESIVSTLPQPSVLTFLDQRLRWAGKWRHHRDSTSKLLAVYIFAFHLLVLCLPVIAWVSSLPWYFFAALFLTKAIVEYRFLHTVTSWLTVTWNWIAFTSLQIIYSAYVVGVGVASVFLKPGWKGRK